MFITIHIDASDKPSLGAPCNGCGVCCLMEPCPLGVLLFWHRRGACEALDWHSDLMQYRCGLITSPRAALQKCWSRRLAIAALAWLLGLGARRWVAAGVGCDCDVDFKRSGSGVPPLGF